jgi:hypothetical protein
MPANSPNYFGQVATLRSSSSKEDITLVEFEVEWSIH